jgi:hypothetical protein
VRLLISGTPTGTLKHITAAEYRAHCGMLVTWRDRVSPIHAIRLGAPWAMDNFAFTGFDPARFRRALVAYAGVPDCLFCVVPDVVGNAADTLAAFAVWHDEIKGHGYPVALAIQNGQESHAIPWANLDAVFIGGDTAFKYSDFVRGVIHEARARGKHTHMGRVNSVRRWNYAHSLRIHSVDGTGMVIERRRVLEALPVIRNRQYPIWGDE